MSATVIEYIKAVVLMETRRAMAMNRDYCPYGRHMF